MGVSVSIAPDILKIDEYGKKMGIDIFRYKDYCDSFVDKKSELQQKNSKDK